MIQRLLLLTFLCTFYSVYAQRKAITHKDYDLWKSTTGIKLSNKGKVVVSTVKTATGRGDGYLVIYNTQKKRKRHFFNGYDATITENERYVVFKRKPRYKIVREEKKQKIPLEKRVKDALFIYDVKKDKLYDSILHVKYYKLPKENSEWLLIEKHHKKQKKTSKSKDSKRSYALVYNLKNKKRDTIFQLKDFVISENGHKLLYTVKGKKEEEKDIGLYLYDFVTDTQKVVDTTMYRYRNLAIDKQGNHFSYISQRKKKKDVPYELYAYANNRLKILIDSTGNELRKNWVLSDQKLAYSKNGSRLFYSSKPREKYVRDTTLLEEETPELDVWTWQDSMIQPEQKAKAKELAQKAFVSYYDIVNNTFVNLEDLTIESIIFDEARAQKYVLGYNTSRHNMLNSWDRPRRRDYYVIDTYTGEKRMLLEKTGARPILTNDKQYALYFDLDTQNWYSIHLESLQKQNLTKDVKVAFYNEKHDRPTQPYAYGFGGFDKDGNALVLDKYDVWKLGLEGNEPAQNITKNGRANNITYRTEKLDNEHRHNATYLDGKLLITSFDNTTKASGLYVLHKGKLIEKINSDTFFMRSYRKAKEKDVFVFRRENFTTYPDLYVSTNGFKEVRQITNANPQQKMFKWGTAELFSWKAYDGTPLKGIIYKPESFDPSKKYPLMTYFYERKSDGLRKYVRPRPSASTVNASYLVSNDYIMFVPDIVYTTGKPGEDAYNCIVSGVEALERLGYIDSANMALQGQSWGGYQTAYLITVTNKFKAAMAGAPVSNMTSAYGGIRWASGQSRAFQYEKTQSRLGKNLWDGLELYLKNSPLFKIPNIETPLLIMHNDADGAVPYYQGIELFMGMRRLQKPVWMLVYNKEAHNLRKLKNKQDLSIRMMQFFDHFLKGEPAPQWMMKGLPRTQKGKNLGYSLENEK